MGENEGERAARSVCGLFVFRRSHVRGVRDNEGGLRRRPGPSSLARRLRPPLDTFERAQKEGVLPAVEVRAREAYLREVPVPGLQEAGEGGGGCEEVGRRDGAESRSAGGQQVAVLKKTIGG